MTISIAPESSENLVDVLKLKEQFAQDPSAYAKLERTLLQIDECTLAERFRAVFTLKSLGSHQAIDILAKGFADSSALLKHELAYVLGQMKDPYAIPVLTDVLKTETEDPMVRHEAAEALGAIGCTEALPVLKAYLNDSNDAVRETCELAVARIHFENGGNPEESLPSSAYASVDPAPALSGCVDVAALKSKLLDTSLSLFERYRAMFTLRNIGTEDAVLALADGLKDSSALFRHEIAYVFGQLQHPASIPALKMALEDEKEVAMVRHECAEALGSIATDACLPVLERYQKDSERVVRESCEVALDMYQYEVNNEFHYGTAL